MIEVLATIPGWAWPTALLAIMLIGLITQIRRRLSGSTEADFAHEYRERFIGYANARGRDAEAYTWLTLNAARMQAAMGSHGIIASFRPPYANYMFHNWPIVLNALPEVRQHFAEDGPFGSADRLADQYVHLLDDAMLRFIGALDEARREEARELRNPLSWLRTGMEMLLSAPISLLVAFGVVPRRMIHGLRTAMLFRATAFMVTSIGLIASIIAFVVDGADAWAKIRQWFGP